MKKLICMLCLALVICMSGCNKDKDDTNNDKEKDKITIVENDVYTTPASPSDAQILLFNALSEALEDEDDEEIANLVAENFVADFYTLKNKAGSEDIGGLTYLPEANRADFVTYASVYAYGNYESIKQKYGTKHLPQVKEVEVTSSVSQDATYAGNDGATVSGDNAIVGVFTYEGKTAYYVVNYNHNGASDEVQTNDITLTFDADKTMTVYNTTSSEAVAASTTNKALALAVEYGGAALVIVE